jgi:hypothetical protein
MQPTVTPAEKTTTPESKQKKTKISVFLGLVLLLIVLLLSIFYTLSAQENSNLKKEKENLLKRVSNMESSISDKEDMLSYCKEYILEESTTEESGSTSKECEAYFDQIERCSSNSCLFKGSSAVEGFGTIKGYYTTIDRVDWGDTNVTCEVIVVTGGSKLLIDDFYEKIENGNRINTLNHNNELLLNINVEDNEQGELIKNSTQEDQVELKVVRSSPLGRSVSVCYSFVDIITVNSK